MNDPIVLIIAALTFFIGGVAKGAMGFGLPVLAIPAITAFGSLPLALSVVVAPVVATNAWQLWSFRAHRNVAFLPRFMLFGLIGLGVGTLVLKQVEDAYLEVALGFGVLLYLVSRGRKRAAMSETRQMALSPLLGAFAGIAHGTTGLSGLVGASFFNAAGLARPAFVFCTGLMFTTFSTLHLPALFAVGLFQTSALGIGLISLAPAFAGMWVGGRLGEQLNASAFPKIVVCMLAFTAVLPIWSGVSKLLAP